MDFIRQLGIFNPTTHGNKTVTVIGAGSVGSFITLTLAKMGIKKITVYDDDVVEEHNMPNQFYPIYAVREGKKKADALAQVIMGFTGIQPRAVTKKYTRYAASHIIISSVDSIEARRKIWALIKPHMFTERGTALYIDTRMGGEYMRIITVSKPADIKAYEVTLLREGEHLPCTARSIVYNVVTIAGLVSNIVKTFLTGIGRMPTQVIFDMATLNMQVFPYVSPAKAE